MLKVCLHGVSCGDSVKTVQFNDRVTSLVTLDFLVAKLDGISEKKLNFH